MLLVFGMSSTACSETRIAILDFELKDLTLKPGTPAELERTASLRPLLERELVGAGYVIVTIDKLAQQQANGGAGYLFDHHDVAAQLARRYGADYILVGRLHKPSFLFVYMMGHLVKAVNGQLIGNFIAESKGSDKNLTGKAIEALAVAIDKVLEQRYHPPASRSSCQQQQNCNKSHR